MRLFLKLYRRNLKTNLITFRSALNLLFTAVSSLHHLLFYPETYSNFSLQLMKSTGISRKFNGIVHMFIVTFGRLSWAGAPEWLPPEARSLCEAISGEGFPCDHCHPCDIKCPFFLKKSPWNSSKLSSRVPSAIVCGLCGMSRIRWKIRMFNI